MRPPAETLAGLGSVSPPPASTVVPDEIPITVESTTLEEPPWAPPRAEPGDMGWDLLYGVKRSMATNVQPKYHFEDDDEPTREISARASSNRPPGEPTGEGAKPSTRETGAAK